MIFKIAIFLLVMVAVYFIFFKKPEAAEEGKRQKAKGKSDKKNSEEMVECAKCGTYVSSKEAIIKNGSFYCSHECAGV